MKSHIEHIPAEAIAYMRRTGAYGPENYALMQSMKSWLHEQGLWDEDGTIYAIAWDNVATTPPEACRYDVCFVTDKAVNDDEVLRGTLLAGAYLVFEIQHTAEAVQNFWASISEFLKKDGVRMDESRPIMERYQFALVLKERSELCVPIMG